MTRSFLLTPRMDAALRQRVLTSLRRDSRSSRLGSRAKIALRIATIGSIALCVGWFLSERDAAQRYLELEKQELVTLLEEQAKGLVSEDLTLASRIVPTVLVTASGDYPGDLKDPSLEAPDALSALLARPSLYVRGPLADFETPERLFRVASESSLDSLAYCLARPPPSRKEADVLSHLKAVRANAEDPQLERLYVALAGLPILAPTWSERVNATESLSAVRKMRELAAAAPLKAARRAGKARVLIFAMDEPKLGNGPTEFDGASRHALRLGVVDLETGRFLARYRTITDPSQISEFRRHRYARDLNGCMFAYDTHRFLRATERRVARPPDQN